MGNGPGDLGSLDAVSQACAIKIRLSDAENLGFSLKPAKRRAVQNAVPVPFRRMPMILGRRRAFLVSTLQQKFVHTIF